MIGLMPFVLGRLVEGDRAVERAVVGDGQRIHALLGGRVDQLGDPPEAVEQAELGVDVEVREVVRRDGSRASMVAARRPARRRPRPTSVGPTKVWACSPSAHDLDIEALVVDALERAARAVPRAARERRDRHRGRGEPGRSWRRSARRACSGSTRASPGRRLSADAVATPSKITIYRGPLVRAYPDPAALVGRGRRHGLSRDRPPLRDLRRAPPRAEARRSLILARQDEPPRPARSARPTARTGRRSGAGRRSATSRRSSAARSDRSKMST